jgi:hypothetical protein
MERINATETPEIIFCIRGSHLLNIFDIRKYLCRPVQLSVSEVGLIGRSLL